MLDSQYLDGLKIFVNMHYASLDKRVLPGPQIILHSMIKKMVGFIDNDNDNDIDNDNLKPGP